jgi:hypothetical protein
MAYGVSAASPAIQQSYSAAYQPQSASNGPAAPAPGPPDLATDALGDLVQLAQQNAPPTNIADKAVKYDFLSLVAASNRSQSQQQQQAAMSRIMPKLTQDVTVQLQQYPQAAVVLQNAMQQGNVDQATLEGQLRQASGNHLGIYTLKILDLLVGTMSASGGAGSPRGYPTSMGAPRGGMPSTYGGAASYGPYSMGQQYPSSRMGTVSA